MSDENAQLVASHSDEDDNEELNPDYENGDDENGKWEETREESGDAVDNSEQQQLEDLDDDEGGEELRGEAEEEAEVEEDGTNPIELPLEEKLDEEMEESAVDQEDDKAMDIVRQKVADRLLSGEEENDESGDEEVIDEDVEEHEEGEEEEDSSSDSGGEEEDGSSSEGETEKASESSRVSGEEQRKRSRDSDSGRDRNRIKPLKRPSSRHNIDLNFFYDNARFYLIKSANQENVSLSKAKGVWATTGKNEANLNRAFRSASHVILIFSVERSQAFQGFARLVSESTQDHSPVNWVLPPGLNARNLGGIFRLHWLCRSELPFQKTMHLLNPWNDNKPVKIGRDGTEIQPRVAERLCSLFAADNGVELEVIKKKARRQLDANPPRDRRPPPSSSRSRPSNERRRSPHREIRWPRERDRRQPAGRDPYTSSGFPEYNRSYGGLPGFPASSHPISIFDVPTLAPPPGYAAADFGFQRSADPGPLAGRLGGRPSDSYKSRRTPPRRASPPRNRNPPKRMPRSTGGNQEPLRRRRAFSRSSSDEKRSPPRAYSRTTDGHQRRDRNSRR